VSQQIQKYIAHCHPYQISIWRKPRFPFVHPPREKTRARSVGARAMLNRARYGATSFRRRDSCQAIDLSIFLRIIVLTRAMGSIVFFVLITS
jgi:hypothetical protein